MSDLERAKSLLAGGQYTCVLCKDDVTLTSTLTGIQPMVSYLQEQTVLHGFSAADKIVGKAAAMLFVLAGIKAVYANVMSIDAIIILKQNNIATSYAVQTKEILNRKGTDICPMEQAVQNIQQPKAAYAAIQSKLQQLQYTKSNKTEEKKHEKTGIRHDATITSG